MAFLDIRKAFDTVWIKGLLYKLMKSGLNQKVLRIIANGYTYFQCSVLIDGEWGDWFIPERGVHQGAPLSMTIYQVYLNELLQQLKESPYGLCISEIDTTCPSFADDVAGGSLYKPGLNSLLHIAYLYSRKWRFDFSFPKSVWMLWGEDTHPDIAVTLGPNELKKVLCGTCEQWPVSAVGCTGDRMSRCTGESSHTIQTILEYSHGKNGIWYGNFAY